MAINMTNMNYIKDFNDGIKRSVQEIEAINTVQDLNYISAFADYRRAVRNPDGNPTLDVHVDAFLLGEQLSNPVSVEIELKSVKTPAIAVERMLNRIRAELNVFIDDPQYQFEEYGIDVYIHDIYRHGYAITINRVNYPNTEQAIYDGILLNTRIRDYELMV